MKAFEFDPVYSDRPAVRRAADDAHMDPATMMAQLGSRAPDLASGIQPTGAANPGAWNTQSTEITVPHAFDDADEAALAGFGPDQY